MIELNQHIATILIQNFYLLHVAIVAEQVEQIRYLLLVILRLRQVLNHKHPRKVVLRLLFVIVAALSGVPAITAAAAVVVASSSPSSLRVVLLLTTMIQLFTYLISIIRLL